MPPYPRHLQSPSQFFFLQFLSEREGPLYGRRDFWSKRVFWVIVLLCTRDKTLILSMDPFQAKRREERTRKENTSSRENLLFQSVSDGEVSRLFIAKLRLLKWSNFHHVAPKMPENVVLSWLYTWLLLNQLRDFFSATIVANFGKFLAINDNRVFS